VGSIQMHAQVWQIPEERHQIHTAIAQVLARG
jgi:hypothetical protein